MLEIALQMILCLLIAAIIGFIIGYLFAKLSCEDTEQTEQQVQKDAELNHSSLLGAPRNNQKDNLTKIKGVGIKIEEKLNSLGVYHFDQIANWDDEFVQKVDDKLAFSGRIQREGWIEQAKVLASGQETEFSKRVESGEVSSSKQS